MAMTRQQRSCVAALAMITAGLGYGSLHWMSGDKPSADAPAAATSTDISAESSSEISAGADTVNELSLDDAVPPPSAPYRVADAAVQSGSTVIRTLRGLGLSAGEAHEVIEAANESWDPARVAVGTKVNVTWTAPEDISPTHVHFKLDETRTLAIVRDGDGRYISEVREEKVERRPAAFAGIVTNNLWSSAVSAGMDPQVIMKLTEIFAWMIDFNREVQLEDRWRLTVEQLYVNGQPIGYGEVLAAEYENVGVVFSAVRYEDGNGRAQFYQPDGQSLRRMFLKSPLKFGRITSGFTTRRFHPILKVNRSHNGVDYGAPTGTPVMAVGDGVITVAAMRGGSGNMVNIRHNAVYETNYKHLSGFAAGIRSGTRVEMGQVIGYVGSTGLSTGPHLHFELHESGRYVDPVGVKFPAADPVPPAELGRFTAEAVRALAELPPWSAAVLTQKTRRGRSASGPVALDGTSPVRASNE